jgi:hypothetical protein
MCQLKTEEKSNEINAIPGLLKVHINGQDVDRLKRVP